VKAFIVICSVLSIAVVGLVFSQSTPTSALVGASQPTNCGAAKGTTKITAHNSNGSLLKTLDSAAKYYTSQASGASNNCVKDIQRAMNAGYCTTGTKLVVDGSYGAKTKTAVTKMQTYLKGYNIRINGAVITVDGKVGPQTWSLLTTPGVDARYNPCS
jgi:peptidoglycan hydrolase-like protein with peptidoglycan-binding domain